MTSYFPMTSYLKMVPLWKFATPPVSLPMTPRNKIWSQNPSLSDFTRNPSQLPYYCDVCWTHEVEVLWNEHRQSVSPSVRPSVCNTFISVSNHGIVLIFCMKGKKGRKVTEPDFSKKISLCPNWAKCAQNSPKWPKNEFFEFCWKVCPLMSTFFCWKW